MRMPSPLANRLDVGLRAADLRTLASADGLDLDARALAPLLLPVGGDGGGGGNARPAGSFSVWHLEDLDVALARERDPLVGVEEAGLPGGDRPAAPFPCGSGSPIRSGHESRALPPAACERAGDSGGGRGAL